MAYTTAERHFRQPVYLLVVENNPSHQQLIAQRMDDYQPEVKTKLIATVQQAADFLRVSAYEGHYFPGLVVLDLDLPDPEPGWQLLQHIKQDSPQLPVVVLSLDQEFATGVRAYELGANTFMSKPAELEAFGNWFMEMVDYWLQIASLPPPPPMW